MANKNFTQFGLSSFASNADYLVGYSKDGNQELRYTAGSLLTAGNYDFIINGVNAGRGLRSSQPDNVVFGINAGTNIASGNANVAIGDRALSASKTSNFNVAIGYQSLFSHTASNHNIAIGALALTSLTGGSDFNTAVGDHALYNLIHRGPGNTAIGGYAMNGATGIAPGNNNFIQYNTAVGYYSLANTLSGEFNSGLGYYSLGSLLSGSYNVGVGTYSGYFVNRGTSNTFVGYNAGINDNNALNCTCLGYNAQTDANNQVQLGDSGTTTYAYGAVQDRSDIRDKADVRDTALGLDFIMALHPVDFKWDLRDSYKTLPPATLSPEATEEERENYKVQLEQWKHANDINNIVHDGTHKRSRYHHGLIAQEVKQVLDAKGIDFGGYQDHAINGGKDVLSIGYNEFVAPLIKAIQELKQEFDDYKASHP